MAQARLSQVENPNYGRFQLGTLIRLASAFDVALVVKFAPFSELIDWTMNLSPEKLSPPDFDRDPFLEAVDTTTHSEVATVPTNISYFRLPNEDFQSTTQQLTARTAEG